MSSSYLFACSSVVTFLIFASSESFSGRSAALWNVVGIVSSLIVCAFAMTSPLSPRQRNRTSKLATSRFKVGKSVRRCNNWTIVFFSGQCNSPKPFETIFVIVMSVFHFIQNLNYDVIVDESYSYFGLPDPGSGLLMHPIFRPRWNQLRSR